jgi:cytosine/adenosine deaminase-related metal-dependent hydrolase
MGVDESLRSGTTTIVDHSYTAASLASLRETGIRAHLVFEMIALRESRIPGFERAYRKLRRTCRGDPRVRVGVAPHAPYTASADLYRAARRWIGKREILSTHLAEHRAEKELLLRGTGDLRWLLEKRKMGVERWVPPKVSPFGFLMDLGVLQTGTLLVHCNYADAKDIEILRETGMPVVYCPRSHAFFGHPRHPVGRYRKAGIPVALGTDSLASNRTLSILDEMRFLAGNRRDLSARALLEMATRDGARALGAHREMGRLAPRYRADLVAVSLAGGDGAPPEARLLQERSRIILTVVDGIPRFDGAE